MFYLSVCEECWRGGSVTGVVFHQGWGGPPAAGGAMSRYAAAREQEPRPQPRPRAPASIIMLHLSLDNVPPPAGIFREQRRAHTAASVLRRASAKR